MTWSETKLVIRDEVVGEKEGFHINCDDGLHYLADVGSKLIGLQLRGSIFAPFLWNVIMLADFQADGR